MVHRRWAPSDVACARPVALCSAELQAGELPAVAPLVDVLEERHRPERVAAHVQLLPPALWLALVVVVPGGAFGAADERPRCGLDRGHPVALGVGGALHLGGPDRLGVPN